MIRSFPLLLLLATLPAWGAGPRPGSHPDHRQPLALSAEEAAHLRLEMRLFLNSVQKIVTAAAHQDMPVVAEAARESGLVAAHQVPPGLRAKLPLEFKKLGHATHEAFDDLARDAESMADGGLALKQLGRLMQNCVSCHATYRIGPAR